MSPRSGNVVPNNLNAPSPLGNEKRHRTTMQSSCYSYDWPSAVKYVPNWPTVTSRLGDIGYIDNSGTWRSVLNILDDVQCRAHGIEALRLSHEKSEYITQSKFNDSRYCPVIRVSSGWECSSLTHAELQRYLVVLKVLICSAAWDATSTPQLAQYPPQQGVEIRRSENSVYRPLNALIAGPGIFIRKLHLPEEIIKCWLLLNWSKIQSAVKLFQISYQPYANNRETCLALMEFITEKWTSVYEDANTIHVDWVPIALGCTTSKESSPAWDNIQLPRPTMRAKLGMGNGQVYTINSFFNLSSLLLVVMVLWFRDSYSKSGV